MVTPIAGVPAVDRMHTLADELYCLTTINGIFEINHYYQDNKLLEHQQIIDVLNNIILQWHRPDSPISSINNV
jgi:predicted phosphoribosyltransferase